MTFIHQQSLHEEGWDTLAQPVFWKQVIRLTSDTCLVNVASCRRPVEKVSRSEWMNLTEDQKQVYKDSVCCELSLDEGTPIFITAGKGEFYEIRKVLPDIGKAIQVFRRQQVDPWYAQAILLIESPGKNKVKSSVGANGPFQLMRTVAQKYGLRVNRSVDERTQLEKAAGAAARFIQAVCIPQVKSILDEQQLTYQETDMWFRLLVLHAYHAGPGNVRCVIQSLSPRTGGIELIRTVWQTECRGFKNESQNYSQIALATLLYFDQLISVGDTVHLVQGDRYFSQYRRSAFKPTDAYEYVSSCQQLYEEDFIEGTLPYAEFMKRIERIRKEYTVLARAVTLGMADVAVYRYPATEEHLLSLAYTLNKKQRYDDAIALLEINVSMHPESPAAHDSLSRAYSLSGNRQMAEMHSSKSQWLIRRDQQQ